MSSRHSIKKLKQGRKITYEGEKMTIIRPPFTNNSGTRIIRAEWKAEICFEPYMGIKSYVVDIPVELL